jgi:hypothetical protein
MKAKTIPPEGFKMPAAAFDGMMRGALGAVPAEKKAKPKKASAGKKPKKQKSAK